MNSTLSGTLSGFVATGPMTLGMFAMHQRLHRSQRSPLSPATLTHDIAKKVTAGAIEKVDVPEDLQAVATVGAHFAFGATAGALYPIMTRSLPLAAPQKGILFGVGVWAVSYLGWIPLAGFRASATRKSFSRNLMIFAAHLIWGASLGYGEELLRRSGQEMLAGERKAPAAE